MKAPATCRIILRRGRRYRSIIARSRQQANAALGQQGDTQLLHDQVAGKAAGVLDDDGADTVAFDAVEEPCKALAALDRIGAAHRGVVVPVIAGDLEASP